MGSICRLIPMGGRCGAKRLTLAMAGAVMLYFLLGNALNPARTVTKHPRDILSIPNGEQQQTFEEVPPIAMKNAFITRYEKSAETLFPLYNASIFYDEDNRITSLLTESPAVKKSYRELDVTNPNSLPVCPPISEMTSFTGHLPQAVLLIQNLKESEVLARYPDLQPGGSWKPANCTARSKVAIILPFRDRQSHLTRLLDFLIPMLKKQMLDFRFIVAEQYGTDLFNKGRIMNAAFGLAEKLGVDCVIFHDVDMFPQDDRNPYDCPTTPRHIGAFVSNLGYQLWYKEIVGGALAITLADYRTVNGYSNQYWAWGGEDDDMGKRILSLNFTIERPDPATGRFSMLKHVKRKRTAPKLIYKLLETADTRWKTDGLNQTGLWKVVKVLKRPLYYHMFVDVGLPPTEWRSGS